MDMATIEEEILNYNFSPEDIEYMKEVEHVQHADLHRLFEVLNKHCISRDSLLWQKYYIENMIREKEDIHYGRGSKRMQFCKHCGETI
jgi:RNase P subunit RPR2